MIRGRTVVVLGAGASYSYGFPLGSELYDKIHNGEYQRLYKEFLDNTPLDENRKKRYIEQSNNLAYHVKHATNKSIDYFLSNNLSFLDRGKEAIALIMLKCEAESKNIIVNRNCDWITILFQVCIDNLRYGHEYPEDKISFITFNYDRSLEYFIYQKMINSFAEESTFELEKTIKKIDIYHVYGKIGEIEWQYIKSQKELGYGWDYRHILLESIRKEIQIMHIERFGQKQDQIAKLIESADRIYFLGFAYDPNNLHAIDFVNEIELQTKGKEIYGTAINVKDRKIEELMNTWGKNHKVILRKDMNCCQLLSEYL